MKLPSDGLTLLKATASETRALIMLIVAPLLAAAGHENVQPILESKTGQQPSLLVSSIRLCKRFMHRSLLIAALLESLCLGLFEVADLRLLAILHKEWNFWRRSLVDCCLDWCREVLSKYACLCT